MTGNRSILGIFLVITLIGAAIVTGLFFWDRYGERTRPATDALPDEYALMIRIPDLENLLVRLNSPGSLADRISGWKGLESFDRLAMSMDSLMTRDLRFSALSNGSTHFLVSCRREGMAPGWLWISEFRDPPDKKEFRHLLEGNFPIRYPGPSGITNASVHAIGYDRATIYFALRYGLFLASSDATLVEQALVRLKKDGSANPGFPDLLYRSAGKNVDANILVNYEAFTKDFSHLINPSFREKFQPGRLAGFSVFDVAVRSQELMMNGYSQPTVAGDQWLSPLVQSIPGEMDFLSMLPFSTVEFIGYGGEASSSLAGTPAGQWFDSWMAQSFAKAMVKVPGMPGEPWSFGIFHVLQGTSPQERAPREIEIQPNSEINGHQTFRITAALEEVFPWIFQKRDHHFFVILDGFLLICPNDEALSFIIDSHLAGRNLDANPRFQQTMAKLPESGNFLYYLDLERSLPGLVSWLDSAGLTFVRDNREEIRNFPSLAVQCSGMGDLIYTNISVPFDTSGKSAGPAVWEVKLDAPLANGPYLLEDDSQGLHLILARDEKDGLYLIDAEGSLLWRISGIAALSGEPSLLTTDGIRKVLFAEQDKLHCITEQGNEIPGFPLKMKSPAVTGPAVVDFGGKKGIRILLACQDKVIYCFEEGGKQAKNWNQPATAALPASCPQFLSSGKDAFIMVTDASGQVMATDKTGKVLFKTKKGFRKSLKPGFWLNRTNSKGIILTTDANGRLSYLSAKGMIQQTDFGEFSGDHDFFYADVDQNGGEDFIYADRNSIYAFDRFKKPVFSFATPGASGLSAEILFGGNRLIYFSLSSSSGQVWLIDQSGRLMTEQQYAPGMPVHFVEIDESRALAITGYEDMVAKYSLPLSH